MYSIPQMLGLVIETSGEKGCIALVHGNNLISWRPLPGGAALSHSLAQEASALTSNELQFVAAGEGPGSYTGLRVGAALAQGLAFGLGIPLIGFCNLETFRLPDDPLSPVLFDAASAGLYYLPPNSHTSQLLPPSQIEEILTRLPRIATPHPERIAKRFPFLSAKLFETDPNPAHLANLLHAKERPPFSMHY
ncbi:MAG: tRNA (adenosine(37)-N6)-threonylcarbamoyltransferase complex dimerization subunit type 1 TsaB [Verrucomicrobiota bacterium]|nr:tRNA (adenosine(37)-N6)-threonylcarbamoyltransferase complex dimerization subunit type 1 TsaB [Verrucomicrobiota bacterium]